MRCLIILLLLFCVKINAQTPCRCTAPETRTVWRQWFDDVYKDFVRINNHIDSDTLTTIYKPKLETIFDSLYVDTDGIGYYYNTFGPHGQNRRVANFFVIMFHDTGTNAQTWTKTGATLKHNINDTIYTQTNLPDHVGGSGFYLCSSSDGFSAVSQVQIQEQGFIKEVPSFRYFTGLATLKMQGNNFTSDLTNYVLPQPAPAEFSIYTNLVRGNLTNMNVGDCANFYIHQSTYNYGYVTALPSYLFKSGYTQRIYAQNQLLSDINLTSDCNLKSLKEINLSNSFLRGSQIDSLLLRLDTWYTAHAPLYNLTVTVDGKTNGYLPDSSQNSHLLSLGTIFTNASKTLTVTYNTQDTTVLDSSVVAFGFDDSWDSFYTIVAPLFDEYGVKATSYLSPYFVNNPLSYPGRLTWAQIANLRSRGFKMESHTYRESSDFLTMTEAQIRADFAADTLAWTNQGLEPPTIMAWPAGKNNALTRSVASEFYDMSRATAGSYFLNDADENAVPAWGVLDTEDYIYLTKRYLDAAIDKKAGLILYFHNVYTTGETNALTIRASYLRELIEYCISKGISIVTDDQVLNYLR